MIPALLCRASPEGTTINNAVTYPTNKNYSPLSTHLLLRLRLPAWFVSWLPVCALFSQFTYFFWGAGGPVRNEDVYKQTLDTGLKDTAAAAVKLATVVFAAPRRHPPAAG